MVESVKSQAKMRVLEGKVRKVPAITIKRVKDVRAQEKSARKTQKVRRKIWDENNKYVGLELSKNHASYMKSNSAKKK